MPGPSAFPIVSVPGERAEAELLRMRQACEGTGKVPVIAGCRADAGGTSEGLTDSNGAGPDSDVDGDSHDAEAELCAAANLSAEAWFEEQREKEDEYCFDESQSE